MRRKHVPVATIAGCVTLLTMLAAPANADNRMKNPSFEQLRGKPSQFGQAFVDYNGWVYDQPGKLAVGTVAHTGKNSYEIINDKGGKTRLQSVEMMLSPGRYRMTACIRGLSVVGASSSALDVCYFDDKFFPLKVSDTFGWTPLTHVFQVDKPIEKGLFMLGLVGSGWLWIDDLTLEKVGDDVALTKEPVLGKEEAPIAPPTPLAADGVHCPECGYLNDRSARSCYACGSSLGTRQVAQGPAVKVLFDFEDGKAEPFSGGKITSQNAPQGKNALLAENGSVTAAASQDWSGYDFLKIDVVNPQEELVMLDVEVRDEQTRDYWTRVNYATVVPPGASTISLPTNMYVGEKSRPGRALMAGKVNFLSLGPGKSPLIFDNIRLERLEMAGVQFKELLAFDFGKPASPVMPGYLAITPRTLYSQGRGCGWTGETQYLQAEDGMQPDALFQDFVAAAGCSFQVDLPNGRYHAIMNIDSPGGYWGEVQQYANRKVSVNGKAVVDETMTMDSFKKWYFHNASDEDLPGLDTFTQYVQAMFSVKQFDFDVTDGKVVFRFAGSGRWPIALSALVIYPSSKAEGGERFWNWTTQQRKVQFNDYFKQIPPKRTGVKAPAEGYVVFTRGLDAANAYDGPRPEDALPAEGLSVTLAKGELQPITLAVQPGSDLGEISLQVSEFTGSGGATLDAKCFTPGWIDYRISRITMEGTVYTVSPRYLRPLPAPAAKVTRNFWVLAKAPRDAVAGRYSGKLTITPAKGQPREIPVSITVLPFVLDEANDIAAGPWGCGISLPWDEKDPKTGQWEWEMFEKSLQAIRDAGFTTVTGLPNIGVKAANGKIELDCTRADREMKALREHGFTQMISSYGASALGYSMYGTGNGPDVDAAKRAGFADMESYLRSLYGAIEEHARANDWVSVAWNLCDEPLGDAAKSAAENAALHDKVVRELHLKFSTFMGATSMEGDDPANVHFALVKALTMPSLNTHDAASIKLIQDAGHRFSFYNGGNRWTFGRYMKALVARYALAYRVTWHYNVVAGNPYYALDCREDDYCWYNSDQNQSMTPSLMLLANIQPGMNDYRYLCTLERLLKERANSPAAAQARKVYEEQINLVPGKDRPGPKDQAGFNADRQAVTKAILMLVEAQ